MMRPTALYFGLVVPLLAGVAPQQPEARSRPLLCYSGPSMKASMEELARTYEAKTGVKVAIETNDPRTLIDRIVLAPTADLFISHDPFLAILAKQRVPVKRSWTVASLVPVIAVAKGNPKRIDGLEGLARPGLRVGLTDAEMTISGHIVTLMLRKAGLGDKVEANVTTRAAAGRELAAMLAGDKIDAGIVWNAVAFANREKMEPVEVRPEWRPRRGVDAEVDSPTMGRLELDYVRVTIALLGQSPSPGAALAFAQYVASPEGVAVFRKNGFSAADPGRPSPIGLAGRSWDFESDEVGQIAEGFASEVGRWEVAHDGGGKVLAQQAENEDRTFNLALVGGTSYKDLDLSVRLKAVAGKTDRGGGLVWRAKDGGNYYIARYNPLEPNLRLYKVEGGKRTQLDHADVLADEGWHTLRIVMNGREILGYLDGKKLLEAEDSTFPDAGRIGLWSKSDARTHFDDLAVSGD